MPVWLRFEGRCPNGVNVTALGIDDSSGTQVARWQWHAKSNPLRVVGWQGSGWWASRVQGGGLAGRTCLQQAGRQAGRRGTQVVRCSRPAGRQGTRLAQSLHGISNGLAWH